MKTKYKHIHFKNVSKAYPRRKTQTWLCKHNSGIILGQVEWVCRWRQYWFVPDAGFGFSKSCTDDISNFIGQLNEERKNAKRKKR